MRRHAGPGEDASPAAGRRREVRPAATTSRLPEHGHRGPTARLTARHRGVFITAPGRALQRPSGSPPGFAFWAKRTTPASLGRERGTTWRAISLCTNVENSDRPTQGLDKQHLR